MFKCLPGLQSKTVRFAAGVVLLLTFALTFAGDALAEVQFDWATVGYPNNPADTEVMVCCDDAIGTTGFGSVGYVFELATTEVTNAQYAEFLNAADPTGTNLLALYPPEMATEPWAGIDLVPTNPIGSKFVIDPSAANWPAIPITFWGALRFANWMHNGQGSSDVQDGAYTLEGNSFPSNANTVMRNSAAKFFVPSENEWYKAAYYDGESGTWYDYPEATSSETLCALPSPVAGTANCDFSVGGPSDVGAYTAETGLYGIFDMGGNALEWTETISSFGQREARGGSWSKGVDFNASSFTYDGLHTTAQEPSVGFRIGRQTCPDTDGDTIGDCMDNCIDVPNPSQDDTDGDSCGNACDASFDNDSVVDFGDFGAMTSSFGEFDIDMDLTEPVTGLVGFADIGVFLAMFGEQVGPSGTTPGTAECPN